MDGPVIDDVSMVFTLPNGGELHALENISLHLKPGELMAVLGPSGCGKTTLLNIVAGFLAPTAGQALLNGRRVTGPHKERGMVFQQGGALRVDDGGRKRELRSTNGGRATARDRREG